MYVCKLLGTVFLGDLFEQSWILNYGANTFYWMLNRKNWDETVKPPPREESVVVVVVVAASELTFIFHCYCESIPSHEHLFHIFGWHLFPWSVICDQMVDVKFLRKWRFGECAFHMFDNGEIGAKVLQTVANHDVFVVIVRNSCPQKWRLVTIPDAQCMADLPNMA